MPTTRGSGQPLVVLLSQPLPGKTPNDVVSMGPLVCLYHASSPAAAQVALPQPAPMVSAFMHARKKEMPASPSSLADSGCRITSLASQLKSAEKSISALIEAHTESLKEKSCSHGYRTGTYLLA